MGAEEGGFSVLNLPLGAHRVGAIAQALAAHHRRPIFSGLFPRATRRNLERIPFADWLQGIPGSDPPDPAMVRKTLGELSVRYVIVHHPADAPPIVRAAAAVHAEFFRALATEPPETLTLGPDYSLSVIRLDQ